jgi:hypothetical protein
MPSELARTMPEVLITVSSSAFVLLALRNTLPPSAWRVPVLMTEALNAAWSTLMLMRPSPTRSSDTRSPAPRAILPEFAMITPSLRTCGPMSAVKPPAVMIEPWLTTLPALPEFWNW